MSAVSKAKDGFSKPDSELAKILERRAQMSQPRASADVPKPKGANNELAAMLERRAKLAEPDTVLPTDMIGTSRKQSGAAAPFNPSTEFSEFSRKEVTDYTKAFKAADSNSTGTLDIEKLKRMMEKLGHAQTHSQLRSMIKEVDVDGDGMISMREFFSIFRKARAGELTACEGLQQLSNSVTSVDVSEVGVGGAKNFFEAKAQELQRSKQAEQEIKAEQSARKDVKQAEVQRKSDFKERLAKFNQAGSKA